MAEKFTKGYALIIGVGADLPCTIDDAKGLADIFKDETRCAYPSEQVYLLTSTNATRDSVLAALDDLTKSTDDESTVIISFSGHGYRVTTTTGKAFYLMTYGYDVTRLYQTAISGAELTEKINSNSCPKSPYFT